MGILINSTLGYDLAQVTQAAAIACYRWVGKGDNEAADEAATRSMRDSFNQLSVSGTVVIGEGERDRAPMLYIGEKVGQGRQEVDIAVDPLEGTNLCAEADFNAITVAAIAKKGTLLHAPDIYMEKIATGAVGLPEGAIDLDNSIQENLKNLAKFKKCNISDLSVSILKRARHEEVIAQVRESGARVKLIRDGDILACIDTAFYKTDMYVGTGGAPEGVIAAAALKCLGGYMQTRLAPNSQIEKDRITLLCGSLKKMAIQDMVKEDAIFAATGVTDGGLLKGIKYEGRFIMSQTLVLSPGEQKTINSKTTRR